MTNSLGIRHSIKITNNIFNLEVNARKNVVLGNLFYCTHLETDFVSRVISILSDDARRLFQVAFLRFLCPPVHQVTLFIELSALVIKTMGDLVTDYEPNGAVIHVPRTIAGEERALQDTGGKLWKI